MKRTASTTEEREPAFCTRVDQFCQAPSPNIGESARGYTRAKYKCYCCGDPVCENCSLISPHKVIVRGRSTKRLVRLCHGCIMNETRFEYNNSQQGIEKGEKIVFKHIYLLAGYSEDGFEEYYKERFGAPMYLTTAA
jgi:hypothetical protein